MHKSNRPRTLTSTVTVHVKPSEDDLLQERATDVGLTRSEWCRQALLDALEVTADSKLVLSELLALRKILILLLKDQCDGRKLSNERLREAVEQAEATKFAMAESRIRQLSVQQPKLEEKVHG
jgi:hypothetical protein